MDYNKLRTILNTLKVNYSIRIEYMSPHELDTILKVLNSKLELETLTKDDISNTFSIKFNYEKKEYTFSGSWFFGNYSIFRIK